MSADSIAAALGGKREGRSYRCRCPLCHHNALIVSTPSGYKPNPLLCCFGGGCDQKELIAWAVSRGLWTGNTRRSSGTPAFPAAARSEQPEKNSSDLKRRRALATYDSAGVAPVVIRRYLRSRGITLTPPALRLASQLWHPFEKAEADAIVGLVEHAEKGRVGLHAIYLAEDDAHKADFNPPKLTFGPVAGGAVRLGVADPNNWLIIGEGIETTLSVMQIMDLPGWAALGTAGVQNLVLPDRIKKVWIAADHDAHGAGQRAAYTAADRFVAEGRQVKVTIPANKGTDWNDVLTKGAD